MFFVTIYWKMATGTVLMAIRQVHFVFDFVAITHLKASDVYVTQNRFALGPLKESLVIITNSQKKRSRTSLAL